MGDEVAGTGFTREDRQRYREKVRQDLDVFERMLRTHAFPAEKRLTGMEIELNLVGADMQPAMKNATILEAIADPDFQTELGQYNIELNVPPRALPGQSALELEQMLRSSLNEAERRARELDVRICAIGILPTLMPEHFDSDWMSANNRYQALNESIVGARGEDIFIDIAGMTGERLATYADTIAPESACTSVQLHLQVEPLQFADYWNAAQSVAGVQLALGANSPYFYGRRLWAETRVELFAQATDTRAVELKNQGVRPRVWFGERWITSIFDLFEENVRYFPALLPELSEEDPVAVLEAGGAPRLSELRLHNGTVYRWNRPIYDVVDNQPHLRVENRILPAGPSIIDTMANSALYFGLMDRLTTDERPVWTRMSFAAAYANFEECARRGIEAEIYWPGYGTVTAVELVQRHLLPMAYDGLAHRGVAHEVAARYLGIIEERCRREVNGASWQVACVEELERRGADRRAALAGMLERYLEHMGDNAPVHTWEQN